MHVDEGEKRATHGAPGLPTGRGAERRPTKLGTSDPKPDGGPLGQGRSQWRARGRGLRQTGGPIPEGLEHLEESTQPPVACRGFITGL